MGFACRAERGSTTCLGAVACVCLVISITQVYTRLGAETCELFGKQLVSLWYRLNRTGHCCVLVWVADAGQRKQCVAATTEYVCCFESMPYLRIY